MMLNVLPILVCAAVVLSAAPVTGQPASHEVSVGYDQALIRGEFERHLAPGFYVNFGSYIRPNVALVGELSHNRRSSARSRERVTSFLGGVRVTAPRGAAIAFATILAGADHFSSVFAPPISAKLRATSFSLQPGGGVGVVLSPSFRVESSIHLAITEPWPFTQWHFRVGGVFRFGR